MVTAPENVYRIWTEIYYECHPGYKMKATNSLKCHPTGCWTPNDLPQCIREDLLDSGWSDSDSSSLPLVISLVTVSTGLAVIALFTTSCLVVLCRRKGGPVPPPSGPAHCKLIDIFRFNGQYLKVYSSYQQGIFLWPAPKFSRRPG